MQLTSEQIKKQSEAAYSQWAVQWREHAKYNSKYEMIKFQELENIGMGKAIVCIANGASLEDDIDLINEYQGKVDTICCDKTLGTLLEKGITPTYCLVCDANVSYEKYLEPYKDRLKETTLIINVCANTKWTVCDWKQRFFFVNMDVINSEKEFAALSGCPNLIPAATNVSNAMVVVLTQSDNKGAKNHFGYDKILLSGFDFSWRANGNYYAFDKDGGGKNQYMRHVVCWDNAGEITYTSQNLLFSSKWLSDYVKAFNLPVVQCGKRTLLGIPKNGELKEQINYEFRPEDAKEVRELGNEARRLKGLLDSVLAKHGKIKTEHYRQYVLTT